MDIAHNPPVQSPAEPTRTCKTCYAQFAGHYCPYCGEEVLPSDRGLARVAGAATVASGRKLLRSLWLLLMRPAFLAKEYVEGRRRPYVHAKTLFIAASIVYLVYMPFMGLEVSLQAQAEEELYSPLVRSIIERRLNETGLTLAEFSETYDPHSRTLSKFLLVELVPMFTLLFAVLFRHRVDYVFDHAVFALYFVTVTMWLDWLIVPTVALAGLKAATWLGFGGLEEPTHWIVTAWAPVLITLVYVYVGANRFYGGSKRENFLRASIAASLYHVLVNLYRFSIFIVALYSAPA